jgi:hypothetical protein
MLASIKSKRRGLQNKNIPTLPFLVIFGVVVGNCREAKQRQDETRKKKTLLTCSVYDCESVFRKSQNKTTRHQLHKTKEEKV